MRFKLFNKQTAATADEQKEATAQKETTTAKTERVFNITSAGRPVLKGFYVSEKASLLSEFNQYVFKVFDWATKNEIKKQVEKMFNVKVDCVKIINLPGKRRDTGKHPGFKSGFKKAVVVLEGGYAIEQAKA